MQETNPFLRCVVKSNAHPPKLNFSLNFNYLWQIKVIHHGHNHHQHHSRHHGNPESHHITSGLTEINPSVRVGQVRDGHRVSTYSIVSKESAHTVSTESAHTVSTESAHTFRTESAHTVQSAQSQHIQSEQSQHIQSAQSQHIQSAQS